MWVDKDTEVSLAGMKCVYSRMLRIVLSGLGLVFVPIISAQQVVGLPARPSASNMWYDAIQQGAQEARIYSHRESKLPDVRLYYGIVCRHEWRRIVVRGRGIDWSSRLQSPVKAVYRWPIYRHRKKSATVTKRRFSGRPTW